MKVRTIIGLPPPVLCSDAERYWYYQIEVTRLIEQQRPRAYLTFPLIRGPEGATQEEALEFWNEFVKILEEGRGHER